MKIGVTGASGQLGSELVRQGCIPLEGRLNGLELQTNIQKIEPDTIINCAAMTAVDNCETEVSTAVAANAIGPWSLSQWFDGYLIQISTDFVFDGHDGPYTVKAKPNPLSIYGWSKLGGELAIRRHKGPWLIIRTTVLFSATHSNFVTKVLDRLQAGQPVTVPPYLWSTPTFVPSLASEIIRLVENQVTGLVHIAGNRMMTRYELACMVSEAFGLDPLLVSVDPRLAGLGAKRPLQAGLITGHDGGFPVEDHDPLEGLKQLKGENDSETIKRAMAFRRLGAGQPGDLG